MSGVVGVVANDHSRYSLFSIALTRMQRPPNTDIDWILTSDRVHGRNILVRRMLEAGGEWVLFLDDDHVFPSDILPRLLAREAMIVGGLYVQRMAPFYPVAYSHRNRAGRLITVDLTKHDGDELVPVIALGTGGMLIRSEVFREMEDPWFEHGNTSEDIIFCNKAVEAGIPIRCDLGVKLGHLTVSAVWPSHTDGEGWAIGFSVSDNTALKVPLGPPDVEGEDENELPM